jgi:sec-independent protein translocase protein TatC
MTLLEHFREFQKRLFRAVLAIAVGAAVAWVFYDQIFTVIEAPFNAVVEQARAQGKQITLAVSGVTDAFTLQLEVVIVVGVILAAPFWLYQLWRFLAPGLTGKERRWAYIFVFSATPLFLLGAFIAYKAMPTLLRVFLGFTPQNVANIINVNDYLSFTLQLVVFFGIGAIIPVVFVMLNFAGLLTGKALLKQWRWLIIGVLTFAAVATPTPDPVNMALAATPFAALLIVAIVLMLLNDARRGRRRGKDDFSGLSDDEASPEPEADIRPEDLRPSPIDDLT